MAQEATPMKIETDLEFIDEPSLGGGQARPGAMKPKYFEFDERNRTNRGRPDDRELIEPEVVEPDNGTSNYDELF